MIAAEELTEHPIPRWDHNRNRAKCLRLTGESDERFRFFGVDVAKLFYPPAFELLHLRELFSAADNANPTCAARSRPALYRNRAFADDTTRIAGVVFALVLSGGRRQMLSVYQLKPRIRIVLVKGDGEDLIGVEEAEDALLVVTSVADRLSAAVFSRRVAL